MESVGSQLRQARLSLGLSLEQASAKTRISKRNLQALEEDDLKGIASPFFYRSFVKQFADYLNIEYRLLAAAVENVTNSMPKPLMPGEISLGEGGLPKPKIAPLEIRRRPLNLRWVSSVLSFGVMLVACSSFYAVWQDSRSNGHGSMAALVSFLAPNTHASSVGSAQSTLAQISPAIPQPPVAAPPSVPASTTASPAKTNAEPGGSTQPDAPQPTAAVKSETTDAQAFRVELSAIERTSVSIVEDGKETFSGILEAAETKVLEGHATARIRTGNVGAVSFVFNGKAIGTLRPRGQVRTVVFTKDNYEVLEASQTHYGPNAE